MEGAIGEKAGKTMEGAIEPQAEVGVRWCLIRSWLSMTTFWNARKSLPRCAMCRWMVRGLNLGWVNSSRW